MGDIGLEHPPLTVSKRPISAEGGAKSDAHDAPKPIYDPDFTKIVRAWPTLSKQIKVKIIHLVETDKTEKE